MIDEAVFYCKGQESNNILINDREGKMAEWMKGDLVLYQDTKERKKNMIKKEKQINIK